MLRTDNQGFEPEEDDPKDDDELDGTLGGDFGDDDPTDDDDRYQYEDPNDDR